MMDTNRTIVCLLILATTISSALELPEHIHNDGWNSNNTRWDFVFSPKNITVNLNQIESLIASNDSTVAQCLGQNGCLYREGKLLQVYNMSIFDRDTFIFASHSSARPSERVFVKIHNYCSTLWNPPMHIIGSDRTHSIEWHSPYSCTANQTNYATPCYGHDPSGKLIDLTHLILSNGSSYEIDTGHFNKTIKQFHLNVCNEATKSCGSNVSSCRLDDKNTTETGFSNLTSIKYDSEEESLNLISLGVLNLRCSEERVKTVVKFQCPKFAQQSDDMKPKLIKADECENIVHWPTVQACPIPDIQVPATSCAIKYEPLGIDINLKEIFRNQTLVEIDDVIIDGSNKTMLLGLCQGIDPAEYRCGGKSSRATSACLLDKSQRSANDTKSSLIVGSILKSKIKLTDSQIILESNAANKTCEVPIIPGFNYTRQVGTRIEVVCSEKDDLKPEFVGFEDCVYVFKWSSTKMCPENFISKPQIKPSNHTVPVPEDKPSPSNTTSVPVTGGSALDDTTKTAHDMHRDTVADANAILNPEAHITPTTEPPIVKPAHKQEINASETVPKVGKMNKLHRLFMIGLIVMSLTAFVVVIFILDRKTNFTIPLGRIGRRARQAFRPQPVPYTRVGFNDNLDL